MDVDNAHMKSKHRVKAGDWSGLFQSTLRPQSFLLSSQKETAETQLRIFIKDLGNIGNTVCICTFSVGKISIRVVFVMCMFWWSKSRALRSLYCSQGRLYCRKRRQESGFRIRNQGSPSGKSQHLC